MSDNFKRCYEVIFTKANLFRSKCPDGDGLGFWKSIKDKLAIYDNLVNPSGWISQPKDITESVLALPEYYLLGNGKKIIDEPHHFLIQQYRIPLENAASFRKIMQIALNAGQFHPNLDKITSVPEMVLRDYQERQGWLLENYIDIDDINRTGCFSSIPISFVDDIRESLDRWLSDHCKLD